MPFENKTCTVRAHKAGLFSLINKVVTAAEIYEHVHVDFSNGTLYSEIGDNLWNHLFEATEDAGGELVESYPHQRYTYNEPASLYISDSKEWRFRLNECYNLFSVLSEFRGGYGESISVLVRSGSHAGEQPSGKLPSIDNYFNEVDSALTNDTEASIYLVSSDNATIVAFIKRYGIRVVYDKRTRRGEDRSSNFHEDSPQGVEDAKQCFREVTAASQSKVLIHPVSNMATAALYMNVNLKSVYIQ